MSDNMPMMIAAAQFSLSLTEFACCGAKGRQYLGDPVYEMITENRQMQTEVMRKHQLAAGQKVTAFYSSCADLVHWHYWCLGVRLPWVNRTANIRAGGWRVGMNIALLSNACTENAKAGDQYAAGDVLHIATPGINNDHVMVVREHDSKTGRCEVAEYGQPGGAIHTHTLVVNGGRMYMGARQVVGVLRLQTVLLKADAAGLLAQPDVQVLEIAAEWADEPPTRPG